MKRATRLGRRSLFVLVAFAIAVLPNFAFAQKSSRHNPTWWDKYQYIANGGPLGSGGMTTSITLGSNVDISNECGPQSETFITLNPVQRKTLAAGSNEIFRLPMHGYFSGNGGANWGGVDLPLPPAKSNNGIDFGSDPTLAFDARSNVFYGYIVVFFGNGAGVNGTEIAVAQRMAGEPILS